jgi:cytochrome c553
MRRIALATLAVCVSGATASAAAPMLPIPHGATEAEVQLGDRIFHGQAAGGKCSLCHGNDAKGTPTGSDLTTGMFI